MSSLGDKESPESHLLGYRIPHQEGGQCFGQSRLLLFLLREIKEIPTMDRHSSSAAFHFIGEGEGDVILGCSFAFSVSILSPGQF